jgi:integrative and conjugative element protein (TIGR02256 family)
LRRRKLLRLSAKLCLELEAESDRYRPRETGGILLGVAGPGKGEWEVTGLIGAGPRAKRERHRFTPDGPWQRAEIAERYARSAGAVAYLGDWHSHPAGNGPSNLDHDTARHIADTDRARCPHPIFLIVTRSKNAWELRAYRFSHRRLRRIEVEQGDQTSRAQARTDGHV